MLESLGYRVIAEATAAEARTALDGDDIDLVLSDVVLPGGTSGPEFADQARALYPGIKMIFMSGYPADAIGQGGALAPHEVLISKPFRK
jgi:CheY-like chemotaxis protein